MDTYEQAVQALNSEDEEIRLQGLKSLASGEPEQILGPIFQAFGDTSWRVRKEAIEMFLRLPISRELVGEIVELLHAEENAGLRNAAVEILVRMGREALPMLLEQVTCPDHDVRKFIVDILGEIGDSRAIPALLNAMRDDDNNVLAAAAENLGKLKASDAVPVLLDAMQNPDVMLRFTILEALGKIDQSVPLSRLLPFRDEKLLRKALIDCLGKVGDQTAIPEVIAGLSDPMRNVRSAALLAMMAMAQRYPDQIRSTLAGHDLPSTVDAVAAFLAESQPDTIRRAAVRVIGWLGDRSVVAMMLELLDQETLQQEAMHALVDTGKSNPDSLVEAWDSTPDSRKAYLAYIMGEAGCKQGVPLLRNALAVDDNALQQMSAHALGNLGSPIAIADLVACLGGTAENVQEAASQALVRLGGQFPAETFDALKSSLEEGDAAQRKFTVEALANINHSEVPQRLGMAMKDAAPEVRRAAVKAFEGRDCGEHLGSILLALADEDSEVRRTAVDILAASGKPEVLDGLQLALSDKDIWVRATAVRAFGRVGGMAVVPHVEQVVKDPVGLVSIAALETLADILGENACPNIVEALNHPDEEVVSAALNLLSGCNQTEWFSEHVEDLINHPFWAVRIHFIRFMSTSFGDRARPLLECRLEVETEDLVRQQIVEALETLPTP